MLYYNSCLVCDESYEFVFFFVYVEYFRWSLFEILMEIFSLRLKRKKNISMWIWIIVIVIIISSDY